MAAFDHVNAGESGRAVLLPEALRGTHEEKP
jgi:hypothetical protein